MVEAQGMEQMRASEERSQKNESNRCKNRKRELRSNQREED